MHNIYEYVEEYDDNLLGKTNVTLVKNLQIPQHLLPKRAGVVVYYEMEEKEQIFPIMRKSLPELQITPRTPKSPEQQERRVHSAPIKRCEQSIQNTQNIQGERCEQSVQNIQSEQNEDLYGSIKILRRKNYDESQNIITNSRPHLIKVEEKLDP